MPEFERAVFALLAGGLLPQLLETRHGLHIVRVTRRIEGRMLAYEQVAQQIAHALSSVSRDTAWRQYIKLLVGAPASRASTWTTASRASACSAAGARHEAPSVLESVSESAAASVHASAVAPGAPSSPASARAGVGLIDGHGRRIDYLRVSVTDRCDLRCTYCLPKDYKGAEIPANWLSHEEMARLVRLFVDNGVRKVRLTGGEPLTRGGVAGLAAAIAAMLGLSDLSLSTNGTRLARHARHCVSWGSAPECQPGHTGRRRASRPSPGATAWPMCWTAARRARGRFRAGQAQQRGACRHA